VVVAEAAVAASVPAATTTTRADLRRVAIT
jgi:hypothetical protein